MQRRCKCTNPPPLSTFSTSTSPRLTVHFPLTDYLPPLHFSINPPPPPQNRVSPCPAFAALLHHSPARSDITIGLSALCSPPARSITSIVTVGESRVLKRRGMEIMMMIMRTMTGNISPFTIRRRAEDTLEWGIMTAETMHSPPPPPPSLNLLDQR